MSNIYSKLQNIEHKKQGLKSLKRIALALIVLAVIAFNLAVCFYVIDVRKNMALNQERMKEYSLHAMKVGAELLEKVNPEISDLKAKLYQLQQEYDPLETAVLNLRKSKDTIFNRASAIEAELNEQRKSLEDIRAFLLTIKVNSKGAVTAKEAKP